MNDIDRRIEGLVQNGELLLSMHKDNEATQQALHAQTQKQIHDLTREVRRFVYWAEATILNQESRLRALTKEPPEAPLS